MPRRYREIWAADCETDPFKPGRIPQPFVFGAIELRTRRYETFSTADSFVGFFRDRKCTVYFHNGGKFDLHYLRAWFNSDTNILLINGRIVKARIGEAEFRDSFALIPVPLAAWEKEKVDYSLFEPEVRELPQNQEIIERYLKSDCVNLANVLQQFFERNGHALTMAGAAMNYWARHHNGNRKPRQSPAQFERYRPFYYGGRVECFQAGIIEGEFEIADKNSAYPDAMLRKHPIACEAVLCDSVKDSLLPATFLTLQCVSGGAFPYRLESGELVFPRDDQIRTYQITGWEFIAALEENALSKVRILECHWFRETVDFADYINYFYAERQIAKANGDKAGDLFSKLYMNSCYGGFAMNPENYHEYLLSSVEKLGEHLADGYLEYHPWGDGRQLLWRKLPLETQERMYKNIATAGSITGHVRAALFRDLCKVQGPLYCDTDSISGRDVSSLTIGRGLGQWKIEARCDLAGIAGKKLYAKRKTQAWYDEELAAARAKDPDAQVERWKIACKGVKLTPDEIMSIASGHTVNYNPAVPTYSITRSTPRFIAREVKRTAKPSLH